MLELNSIKTALKWEIGGCDFASWPAIPIFFDGTFFSAGCNCFSLCLKSAAVVHLPGRNGETGRRMMLLKCSNHLKSMATICPKSEARWISSSACFFCASKLCCFLVGLSNLKEFEISAAVSSRNLKKCTGISLGHCNLPLLQFHQVLKWSAQHMEWDQGSPIPSCCCFWRVCRRTRNR